MRVALDTNIISYLWKGDRNIRTQLTATGSERIHVPSVVLAELAYGKHKHPEAALKLDVLIKDFNRIRELALQDWTLP